MGLKFSNFGKAIVASAPSGTSGLSFTVEAGKGLLFPSLGAGDYFYGIFKDSSGNREVVKVEARSTDAMTIATGARGLDGTTARTWSAGDYFVAGICNIAMQEVFNTNLTAIGTLVSGADKLPYFTGSGTASTTDLSAFARTLLDDASAAAMRTTLGASPLASPTFTGTVTIPTLALTDNLAIADGGTGAGTAAAAFAALKQQGSSTATGVWESATDGEAQAGTDSARCVTPANLSATVLGIGQTWQNMTASRATGTTYVNSTGRPILLNIKGTISIAGAFLAIAVEGSNFAFSNPTYTASSTASITGALIPAGASYAASPSAGTLTSITWMELR